MKTFETPMDLSTRLNFLGIIKATSGYALSGHNHTGIYLPYVAGGYSGSISATVPEGTLEITSSGGVIMALRII